MRSNEINQSLLEIKNMVVTLKDGHRILDNISFSLSDNTLLGVIGESGSGKSITTKAILKLLDKSQFDLSGQVLFEGNNLVEYNDRQMQTIRGKNISVIFQNPMTALNPLTKVGRQMTETIRFHFKTTKQNAYRIAFESLSQMDFENPDRILKCYPYELSGGMLQRVVIAIALSLKPKILIADEPTTALDVDTREIILKEIMKLKDLLGLSIIYITHETDIIKTLADDIVVIKDGGIIESGSKEKIIHHPEHPYTQLLLNEIQQYKIRR